MLRFFIMTASGSVSVRGTLETGRILRMIETLATLQPMSRPSWPGSFKSPELQNWSLAVPSGSGIYASHVCRRHVIVKVKD